MSRWESAGCLPPLTFRKEWLRRKLQEVRCQQGNDDKMRTETGKGGIDGLRLRKASGAKSKLTAKQKERLVKMLLEGASAHGWSTGQWTIPMVGELIERMICVKYHPGRLWWVLHDLGMTWQKPQKVAREKDERKKKRWLMREWPELKKN